MSKSPNITGQTFGRLTVVEPAKDSRGHFAWKCHCMCGNTKIETTNNLTKQRVKSCGCLRKDVTPKNNYRHGHATKGKKSSEYQTWVGMRKRCYNKNDNSYKRYGARGITVCKTWQGHNGFKNFLSDLGPKPSPKHSLERCEVNKGYSPDNCCWATRKEQANNRRKPLTLGVKAIRDYCCASVNDNVIDEGADA